MIPLRNIAHIALITELRMEETDFNRSFPNYFRLFKKKEESLYEDRFFSPFFKNGEITPLYEDYGFRKDAMNAIIQALKERTYIPVCLIYDFRLAAVNEEYCTDGEFEYMIQVVEKTAKERNMSVIFMVSHFNQLVGKELTKKPEHYHILLEEVNSSYG